MNTGTAEVGCLYWKDIRNLVLLMQNQGSDIHLTEGKGWFSRPFFFRGSADAIARLTYYVKCLEAS